MKIPQLESLGLTITQAAYWLEVEPSVLAEALDNTEWPQWVKYCMNGLAQEKPEDFHYYRLGTHLRDKSWSATTASAAIPVLIEQARRGEVITYGDLDAELKRRDPLRADAGLLTKYGKPLGIIGGLIEEIRAEANDSSSTVPASNARMPPLEAIVVDGRKRMPGKGINYFLISYLKLLGHEAPEDLMLRAADRRAAVERIQSDVFAWNDWSILEKLSRA
jgi:hypothetical protein